MTRLNISIISVSGSPSRICPPKKTASLRAGIQLGVPSAVKEQGLSSIGRNATDLLTENTHKRLFFYKTNPSPY